MQEEIKPLMVKVLDISYRLKLCHIGSNLSALPIIWDIYKQKKKDEKFVLSAGHAHLAHAVVMEHYGIIKDAVKNIKEWGIHCDVRGGCDVSTGSLGHGIGIAAGIALADRDKNVYCLLSDGELAEGSIYEAMNIVISKQLDNIVLVVNANGYSAYAKVNVNPPEIFNTIRTNFDWWPKWLQGLESHYHIMSKEEYEYAASLCK